MNRLRLLLLLLCTGWLAGCQADPWSYFGQFYRVRVVDPRGELIADWIAVGRVARTETGYRFRAVERFTNGPHPQRMRYPNARLVEASGPNIIIARCGKPYWLDEMKYGPVQEEITTTTTRVERYDYKQ